MNYAYIFIVLAISYALQLLLTGLQAKRFFRRMRELRKNGVASVGQSGSKWSGRVFAVLVVNEELEITNAEVLSGFTIFSNLKPVNELVGHNIHDLLENGQQFDLKKKQLSAFINSARHFLDDQGNIVPLVEESFNNPSRVL